MFLGAASFAPGNGGIARLARLTARALVQGGADLDMLAYLDAEPFGILGRTPQICAGRKLAFLARCHLAALSNRSVFYDSVGVARAHPRIPGLAKPYGLWMCGIEVWEGAPPHAVATLGRATLPVAISHHTLQRYGELHGDLPAARVCWLGTEEDAAAEVGAEASGPPTVLLVGRIDAAEQYSKGQHEMVRAWPAVVATIPDARLVIVGGGSGLEALRAAAAESPAANRIEIAGFVPEAGMAEYWRRAHLFAMPSRGEGFGLVYIEAMRHGLPVIASVHDAGREVNAHGETGLNVSLDEPDALAAAIVAVLSDPSRRRTMGEAALARWREHFSFSAFCARFIPIARTLDPSLSRASGGQTS